MAKSSIALRNAALTALLAAGGCGGDDNHNTATTDSGSPDTGIAYDAGALNDAATLPDAAILDASASDSSVAFDAATTDAAAPDASAPDAGDPELAAALNTDGVVVTMRRVQLVLGAFCRAYATCTPGTSETDCLNNNNPDWADPSIYESNPDWPCDDSTLDVASCAATTPCDQVDDVCGHLQDIEDMLCADDAGA